MSIETVSVDVIGQLLDLTPRRVQQLAADGAIPRSAHGQYELIPVVRAYVQRLRRDGDLSAPKLSDAALRTLRSRLMTIPERIAPELASTKTSAQVKKLFRSALNDALMSIGTSAAPWSAALEEPNHPDED